jgi:hypothetical protein
MLFYLLPGEPGVTVVGVEAEVSVVLEWYLF